MNDILLIGGGGHCKVVIDAILSRKEFNIRGIIDIKDKIGHNVLDVPIIGSDEDIQNYFADGIKYCFISTGSVGSTNIREKLFSQGKSAGYMFPNIIHAEASVSPFAELGSGNYIAPDSRINAGTKIANQCIINTGAIIDHDCSIDDFVHIAPGVSMSGSVHIGAHTHIGTGGAIIQSISIGARCIIGAGSVVVANIDDYSVAYGNPCRIVRKNNA